MHLGNGIICPLSAVPMLGLAGFGIFYSFKKAKDEFSADKIFYVISLTCLVFAMQMINFSIPQTGSSGHFIGWVLLSILLGPFIAFLSICAILLVQSLFFADGGVLALGCNIVNMGAIACFIVYPFIYKPLNNNNIFAILISCIVALQLGSFLVVLESFLSGTIELNSIAKFCTLMQIIHMPIGVLEGILSCVIYYVAKRISSKKMTVLCMILSVILAGLISGYASKKPDGLEWALLNINDSFIADLQNKITLMCVTIQNKCAFLSNIPGAFANLTGVLLVAVLMYFICLFMLQIVKNTGNAKI